MGYIVNENLYHLMWPDYEVNLRQACIQCGLPCVSGALLRGTSVLSHLHAKINFQSHGVKWLALSVAKSTPAP